MKAVGTKQLKNELSRYLQLVRQGEVVLVLDRDDVVAEMRKPVSPLPPGADRWDAVMAQLEADDVLIPARNPGGSIAHLLHRRPPVPDAERLIQEARDDRF